MSNILLFRYQITKFGVVFLIKFKNLVFPKFSEFALNHMSDSSATLDETRGISASILFMLFLLVANEITQTFLSKLKNRYSFLRYLQPTSITTLIGYFVVEKQ